MVDLTKAIWGQAQARGHPPGATLLSRDSSGHARQQCWGLPGGEVAMVGDVGDQMYVCTYNNEQKNKLLGEKWCRWYKYILFFFLEG